MQNQHNKMMEEKKNSLMNILQDIEKMAMQISKIKKDR